MTFALGFYFGGAVLSSVIGLYTEGASFKTVCFVTLTWPIHTVKLVYRIWRNR